MKDNSKQLDIDKLKGGLDQKSQKDIDDFFIALDQKISLPLVSRNLIFDHFIEAYEYYLDKGESTKKINKIISPNKLSNFYLNKHREFYNLDNAAIVYPLGMRHGQMPMFRISANLNDEIVPCLLQLALDITIKRFPTISAIVKRGFFWHYLESTNNIPIVEEEKDIPCRPISIVLRSYRSFRVLYYKKRISLEVFHAITDGAGAICFLKTLLSVYMELLGKKCDKNEGVLDVDEQVRPQELVNEFKFAKQHGDFNTFVDKQSLQLDGKLTSIVPSKIIHFELNSLELKNIAKKYGGTVTSYILAVQFLAAKKCISKHKGVFNIQVPVNMRKYNGSTTLRNYSMYFNASMDINDIDNKTNLVKEFDKQIKEKGSQKMMEMMMSTTGEIIKRLSALPLFIKGPIMQLVYGHFASSFIGGTLTNLGVVKVPKQMNSFLDKFSVVVVPGRPNRYSSSLITFNDKAVLTVAKAMREETFENEIYQLFKEDGLEVVVEASIDYES